MSFLASLSPEARDELDALIDARVAAALAARERADARREWLTTADAAVLVSASENAVRCRLRRGWLAGSVAKDGSRLLVRRSAVLDDLDARATRRTR